jgi:hypothetical protein
VKRTTELRRTDSLQRSAAKTGKSLRSGRRKSISPASPAQRAYVREVGFCMACGAEQSDYVRLTFAHWWPRGRGGCDSKLCGSVLCCRPGGTGCHDRQERGELDLLALIVEEWDDCRERFQHALEHARPVELLEKLAGARIEWSRHTTRRETG